MNFLLRFCLYSYHEPLFNLRRKERKIKIFPTKSESVKTEICNSSCQRRGLMFSPDSRSKCRRKYCLDHTPPLRCLRAIFREGEELKSDDSTTFYIQLHINMSAVPCSVRFLIQSIISVIINCFLTS